MAIVCSTAQFSNSRNIISSSQSIEPFPLHRRYRSFLIYLILFSGYCHKKHALSLSVSLSLCSFSSSSFECKLSDIWEHGEHEVDYICSIICFSRWERLRKALCAVSLDSLQTRTSFHKFISIKLKRTFYRIWLVNHMRHC